MRLKIVAGNWKMNNTFDEAKTLINKVINESQTDNHNQVNIFAVPFPFLITAHDLALNHTQFAIASQNCSSFAKGAYTGEVSAAMLASIGIKYCLVGHSERRTLFNEKSSVLLDKLKLLLAHDIRPIWCCGEQFEDRNNHNFFKVVQSQLEQEVFQLSKEEIKKVIIAYEPVWAIGTGLTASPAQAQEMHAFIRAQILLKFDKEVADNISILYGGSCNAENAKELFSLADVDGGLIGGASLQSESFVKLISIMHELH
ncbi:MAG TPA: triose-phosphate isomerase [Bacteroidia bacterium]|nr:triose-phosphate isomerase [Bacteroidia bacterium]